MGSISMSKYEQEYKEMKQVLRGIAHEMGNALTVLGYSIKTLGRNEEIKTDENWGYINEDYDYICRLFKNLSAYNNSRELELENINLDKLLGNVVAVLKDEYGANGVHIQYNGLEDSIVLADEVKLKQVFINIIKNAYEAVISSDHLVHLGLIKINIEEGECGYKVHIIDNGCGIKKENLKKIFEPMYTENKEGGTGLGLPVCKNIIESHGGQISVKSKEGEGTEFVVWLMK